ncbi:hypothetical protein KJ059_06330 [Myxococcota bacterium]|nr:hypothetical protein [Myxococcota bacterium]MCZ7618185.1 hypothetical protein [Myxococcota bacterium]
MRRLLRSRPAPALLVRLAAVLIALPLLGAGACDLHGVVLGLPAPDGSLPVTIALRAGIDPAAVRLALDGADVSAAFEPGGPGLTGTLPLPTPGHHRLTVTRPLTFFSAASITTGMNFEAPSAAPAVLALDPADGSTAVPPGAWLRFRLAESARETDLVGFGFGLECDGVRVARAAHALADGALVLNPSPALPPGATCRVVWRAVDGAVADTTFAVAPEAAGLPATALYDRTGPFTISPFPDDYWLADDPGQASGKRIALPELPFPHPLQRQAFATLTGLIDDVDGWSRQTPIVIALSHPLDDSMIPSDELASADPFTPIALVDVDPMSPQYRQRIPYRLLARSDPRPGAGFDHTAILFPSVDLRERGRYAMVFTRRAFATGEPGRGFGPAPQFEAVLAEPDADDAPETQQARRAVGAAVEAVASLDDVPIPREDIALALSISIRTQPSADDLTHVKELALASPAPELVLPDLAVDPCPTPGSFCIRLLTKRAVEVRGRVRLPRFRTAAQVFARDPNTGLPQPTGIDEVPLVLTLPHTALDAPAVPVMYQHGNPGSPAELLSVHNEQLDDAGFALLGFQDSLNRELAPDTTVQVLQVFIDLLQNQKMPEYWLQTGADQIFFLRAIQGMASLDLLHRGSDGQPALGPDGEPEIDPSLILYKGISEGANNAQRFLPFAPELLAAEATVGGARLAETLIHQSASEILEQITALLPELRPVELWVGLALFQAGFDPQDGHTYLRHLYREPLLPFAGSHDVTPPSTLWTEGVGDSLVPNNASRAMAAELGIPHVRPVASTLPTLVQIDTPLAGNLAPGVTAGYFQFDPWTTPDCLLRREFEGHFCPQSGAEAKAQRLHFLLTALDGAAEIIDPF